VTPYLPHERVGHGGGTAVRGLVTWLARRHEVLVASLVRPGEEGLIPQVEALGVRVAPLPFLDRGASGADRIALAGLRTQAKFRSWVSGYPYFVEKYRSGALAEELCRVAEDFQPDAIQIEYLQMAPFCLALRTWRDGRGRGVPRLVLNTHELGSVPRERRAVRATNPLTRLASSREAAQWQRLQVDATHWADRTLCVTENDRKRLENMGGINLTTVPLGMDLEDISGDWSHPGMDRFLFLGSLAHRPNRLAADFLLDEVWPLLRNALPEAELVLAGRGFDNYLAARPETEGVTAPGFIPDLGPLFRGCSLFLAPLPEGGGIKIKILEALARGIPVITTPVGAEGILEARDEAAWITACDDTFARAVMDAVNDSGEAAVRAARGRCLMEEKFSWASITERLTGIYEGA